jgi:hypothetical protein
MYRDVHTHLLPSSGIYNLILRKAMSCQTSILVWGFTLGTLLQLC